MESGAGLMGMQIDRRCAARAQPDGHSSFCLRWRWAIRTQTARPKNGPRLYRSPQPPACRWSAGRVAAAAVPAARGTTLLRLPSMRKPGGTAPGVRRLGSVSGEGVKHETQTNRHRGRGRV